MTPTPVHRDKAKPPKVTAAMRRAGQVWAWQRDVPLPLPPHMASTPREVPADLDNPGRWVTVDTV